MAEPSDKPHGRRSAGTTGLGTIALVVALFAILFASIWFAARAFLSVEGPPMPESGYIAMTLGVGFSLLVGFALMALLFYSSRHGYDEQVYDKTQRAEPEREWGRALGRRPRVECIVAADGVDEETAAKLRRALNRAIQWLRENEDRSRQQVLRDLPSAQRAQGLMPELIGVMSYEPAEFQEKVDWMMERGFLQSPPKFSDVVRNK